MTDPVETDDGAGAVADPAAASVATGSEQSLLEDIKVLIDDGRTLLEAELAFQKVRVAYGWQQGRAISLLLLIGFAFAFFAMVAVVVGLLLALLPHFGPWGALAIMAGLLSLLSLICLVVAARKFSHARQQMFKAPPVPDAASLANAVERDNRSAALSSKDVA